MWSSFWTGPPGQAWGGWGCIHTRPRPGSKHEEQLFFFSRTRSVGAKGGDDGRPSDATT